MAEHALVVAARLRVVDGRQRGGEGGDAGTGKHVGLHQAGGATVSGGERANPRHVRMDGGRVRQGAAGIGAVGGRRTRVQGGNLLLGPRAQPLDEGGNVSSRRAGDVGCVVRFAKCSRRSGEVGAQSLAQRSVDLKQKRRRDRARRVGTGMVEQQAGGLDDVSRLDSQVSAALGQPSARERRRDLGLRQRAAGEREGGGGSPGQGGVRQVGLQLGGDGRFLQRSEVGVAPAELAAGLRREAPVAAEAGRRNVGSRAGVRGVRHLRPYFVKGDGVRSAAATRKDAASMPGQILGQIMGII